MKIETIKSRVANAEAAIKRKQNTIASKKNLIQKKTAKAEQADGLEAKWLRYDIEILNDDIDKLQKEINEKVKALEEYQEQLRNELEKEQSRNVAVILQFLENWKEQVHKYYLECLPRWVDTKNEYRRENRKYCDYYNNNRSDSEEERKAKLAELKDAEKAAADAHSLYAFLNPYIVRDRNTDSYSLDMQKIKTDVDYEANRKYDFIIEKTTNIVGKITDASDLRIGSTGELNGNVIGTTGTANVRTIGAGGYNIQCYHFRTLIHRVS